MRSKSVFSYLLHIYRAVLDLMKIHLKVVEYLILIYNLIILRYLAVFHFIPVVLIKERTDKSVLNRFYNTEFICAFLFTF